MTANLSFGSTGGSVNSARTLWGVLLVAWCLIISLVPDPRPLAAPAAAVRIVRDTTGISDAEARLVTTVVLRAAGLGLIGVLAALFFVSLPGRWGNVLGLIVAPLLGWTALWINLGHFPLTKQLWFALSCVVAGVLLAMVLRRSWIALGALLALAASLFLWGTSTAIPDEVDAAARLTGMHILDRADEVPRGDEGFTELLRIAFAYAEDNSHGRDAVLANRAAILALGVILGETRIAAIARREVDRDAMGDYQSLRRHVTLRGRNDLPKHFWVSGALQVIADENRAMTVGLAKELMDAQPGGSGFSFADKAANMAGIRFAEIATANPESAYELQLRILGGMTAPDFCPDISGLPEGLSSDQFFAEFGGLAGARTRQVFKEIEQRLAACPGLAPIP